MFNSLHNLRCKILRDAFGLERKLPKQDEIVEAWVDLDYPVKYEGEEIADLLHIPIDEIEKILAL